MKPTLLSRDLGRNAARAEALLKHLAHAGRLTILCALVDCEKPVGELVTVSGLSQSAVSQHLAKLRLAGLVETRRDGQSILYRLADGQARAVLKALHRIFCKE
jgi:DNA-binding transcriptional ArsR family regulator